MVNIKPSLFRLLKVAILGLLSFGALHAQEETIRGCCRGTIYDGLHFYKIGSNTYKAVNLASAASQDFSNVWSITTSEDNSFSIRYTFDGNSVLTDGYLADAIKSPLRIKFNYQGLANKLTLTNDLYVGSALINPGDNSSAIQMPSNGALEFGYGVSSKSENAGIIRYQTGDDTAPHALEIFGAGQNYIDHRQITLWAESGIMSKGPYRSDYIVPGSSDEKGFLKIRNGIHIIPANTTSEASAGCIASRKWTAGLDIVGAGTVAANRKITFWAEAGIAVTGPMVIGIGTVDNISPLIRTEYLGKNNLWVAKGIISEDYGMVNVGSWKDEVLKKGYQLPTLQDVEVYIKQYKHLPGLPSEDEVKANGYSVYEFHLLLLEKVEQLTLYTLQKEHRLKELRQLVSDINALKEKVNEIRNATNANPKD